MPKATRGRLGLTVTPVDTTPVPPERSRGTTALLLALLLTLGGLLAPTSPPAYADLFDTRLELAYTPTSVAPDQPVQVSGQVVIADQPAPAGVPVEFSLDDGPAFATLTTAPDGNVTGTMPLPAGTPFGPHRILATVPGDDTRLPGLQEASVTVVPGMIGTRLELRPTPPQATQGEEIQVSGTLWRNDLNIGMSKMSVYAVTQPGGSAEGMVTTDDAGNFTLTFRVPDQAGSWEPFPTYTVNLAYDGTDAFAPVNVPVAFTLTGPPAAQQEAPADPEAQASDQPSATPGAPSTPGWNGPSESPRPPGFRLVPDLVRPWMLVVGGAGFIALIGAAMLAHRRRSDEDDSDLLP